MSVESSSTRLLCMYYNLCILYTSSSEQQCGSNLEKIEKHEVDQMKEKLNGLQVR